MAVTLPVPLKALGPSVQAAGVPASPMQPTTLTIGGPSSPAFTLRLEVYAGDFLAWLQAGPLITAPGSYALSSMQVQSRRDGSTGGPKDASIAPFLLQPASGFGTFRLCLVDGNANGVTASLS